MFGKIWRAEKKTYSAIIHDIETKKDLLEMPQGILMTADMKHYYVVVGRKILDMTLYCAKNLKNGQRVSAEEITDYLFGIPVFKGFKLEGEYAAVFEEKSALSKRGIFP